MFDFCVICECYLLLSEGYPNDEAASLASLQYRQREANSLFLGYYEDSELYAVSYDTCCVICCLCWNHCILICTQLSFTTHRSTFTFCTHGLCYMVMVIKSQLKTILFLSAYGSTP